MCTFSIMLLVISMVRLAIKRISLLALLMKVWFALPTPFYLNIPTLTLIGWPLLFKPSLLPISFHFRTSCVILFAGCPLSLDCPHLLHSLLQTQPLASNTMHFFCHHVHPGDIKIVPISTMSNVQISSLKALLAHLLNTFVPSWVYVPCILCHLPFLPHCL